MIAYQHMLAIRECEAENRYYSGVRGYWSTYYRACTQGMP